MKFLFSSDWHADAKTLGHRRLGDVDRAVREVVDACIARKVDCFVFCGDLCDPDSGSAVFRSIELAISAATELSRAGIRSRWLAGNHDVIEDGTGDTTLSPLRALRDPNVRVWERPGSEDLSEEVRLVLLPFTATSHAYRPSSEAEDAIGNFSKLVVVSHLAVEGVQPGEETTDMPRGRDVLFPREMFTADVKNAHIIQGHYHRAHTHELPGFLPVHIVGSPARFTFGESEHIPSFLVLEV